MLLALTRCIQNPIFVVKSDENLIDPKTAPGWSLFLLY